MDFLCEPRWGQTLPNPAVLIMQSDDRQRAGIAEGGLADRVELTPGKPLVSDRLLWASLAREAPTQHDRDAM